MVMRRFICFAVAMLASMALYAQEFDANFIDKTLRIDYTLLGNASEQHVALRDMSSTMPRLAK